jgi:hypothetical protein
MQQQEDGTGYGSRVNVVCDRSEPLERAGASGSTAGSARPEVIVCLLLVVGGCGGGGSDQEQVNTETDGVVTTGVSDEGADETAEQPPYFCIYNEDNPGYVGVKHQCSLEYDLDISFTVTPPVGPSFVVPMSLTGVQTLNDSTYEHPFVMACCSHVTDHADWPFADSCGYLHHKACLSDFIEHICDAPGVWLQQAAHEHIGQGAEAIEAAASWFKGHRQDCYDHFWLGPDALYDVDDCAPEFDGFFDHTPWEPGKNWSYNILGIGVAEISDVVIAPRSSLGESVPQAPPPDAQSCTAPDSNNGETPGFSVLSGAGELVSPVAPVSIDVMGPAVGQEAIRASGDLSTDSVLQWSRHGADELEIERWSMVEHAATSIGTSALTASVEGFRLELLGPRTAATAIGGWQVDERAALFNLVATIDGIGSNVQATNATPIRFHVGSGGVGACPTTVACLVSRPFTIDYEDALGRSWVLDIPTITWSP